MAAAAINKTYNIYLTLNVKRGKDDYEYAKAESEKLHNLITNQLETAWAKGRIEKLHEMVFLPNTDQIKAELAEKLKKEDEGEE